jgi:hypothetical protein
MSTTYDPGDGSGKLATRVVGLDDGGIGGDLELHVHQSFRNTGHTANAIRLTNPSVAVYLTRIRAKIRADVEYAIQVHRTASAPSDATTCILAYAVLGSTTGAGDPLDLDLGGGDLFTLGCWLVWSDDPDDPTAWNPVALSFTNEIDTWHVVDES